MSKIGIITLYKDNFGSILQCFSIYSYLSSLGHDCSILQITYSKSIKRKIKKVSVLAYKSIRYKKYYTDKLQQKRIHKESLSLISKETKQKMDEFVQCEFKIEVCDEKELKKLNHIFDFFITGSDQVWNGYDNFRYLTFADKNKKISLAPSFGSSQIKKYDEEYIKKAIEDFNFLSVREESGARIIKELIGRDAIRLSDPTVLLTKKDWIAFSEKGISEDNYIFVHFLNKPNNTAISLINEYIAQSECIAVCVCNNFVEYEQLSSRKFIDINPYDYVSLIADAKCVFTDSFHTTLFSLYLETQFYTFERQYLTDTPQNARIIDLLDRLDMRNRFVTEKTNINLFEVISWRLDNIFQEERESIKAFINKSLLSIK